MGRRVNTGFASAAWTRAYDASAHNAHFGERSANNRSSDTRLDTAKPMHTEKEHTKVTVPRHPPGVDTLLHLLKTS